MSKEIRIWSFGDVDRSGKVRWTAEELGYRIEEQRLKLGEQTGEAYRALNPYSQIPTARVGGEAYIESTAICILLAEREPEARLIPADSPERDRFWQLLHVCSSTLEAPVVSYYLSRSGLIDAAWADLWEKPLRPRLQVLARDVPESGYLCGSFSVADICAAYVLRIGVQSGLLRAEGALRGYLERLLARPAAQAARFFDRLEL